MYESARRNKVDTGPLETWDKFTKSWNQGNKEGVMKELTPGMQEKFGPTYDKLQDK